LGERLIDKYYERDVHYITPLCVCFYLADFSSQIAICQPYVINLNALPCEWCLF